MYIFKTYCVDKEIVNKIMCCNNDNNNITLAVITIILSIYWDRINFDISNLFASQNFSNSGAMFPCYTTLYYGVSGTV